MENMLKYDFMKYRHRLLYYRVAQNCSVKIRTLSVNLQGSQQLYDHGYGTMIKCVSFVFFLWYICFIEHVTNPFDIKVLDDSKKYDEKSISL
jgi:hypothetical protein